jgi:sugar/nucleoside kinase (ribokinase family)
VSRPDLLTVGEAFEDLIFIGLPMLPRPGEEVKTSRFVATVGGGAVISAVAAARLGLSCRVVTGVGDTGLARLEHEGVSVANLRRPGEAHAISAALSTATNRSFVTFNGINDVLESRLPAALAPESARHVHFAFYPHACAPWEAYVLALKQRRITTSWDFGWNEALLGDRRFPHLLRTLDYVFLNEQEAVLYSRRHDLTAALAVWRDAPSNVIVKLGAKGSRWLGRSVDLHVPTRRIKVVDTTGAGDAFNGGFLTALLRGYGHTACLRLGNFVGTLSTRKAGGLDGLPSLTDVPAAFADLAATAAARTATKSPRRVTRRPSTRRS